MTEQEMRHEQMRTLVHSLDYAILRRDYDQALYDLDSIRNIILTEQLAEELQQMRKEIDAENKVINLRV